MRAALFLKQEDHVAFDRVLEEVSRRVPIRILGDCLMTNHW